MVEACCLESTSVPGEGHDEKLQFQHLEQRPSDGRRAPTRSGTCRRVAGTAGRGSKSHGARDVAPLAKDCKHVDAVTAW